jgi:hypothetical protein
VKRSHELSTAHIRMPCSLHNQIVRDVDIWHGIGSRGTYNFVEFRYSLRWSILLFANKDVSSTKMYLDISILAKSISILFYKL